MFKVGKRTEKIKIVFKLQFQATQVAKPGSKLTVSLISEDVGRATVKLGKAVVGEDGSCTWDDPVYETVKLTRETKTGKVQDKFYHFVVATGSSKKGFVGEILFNFADFLEAIAPVAVWQPIKGPNSEAALHVTIQNVQGGEDPRVIEENGGFTVESQDRRLGSQLSSSTTERNSDLDSNEDEYWNSILSRDDERSKASFNGHSRSNSIPDQRLALDLGRNSTSNSRQGMGFHQETSSSEPSPSWNSLSQRNSEDKVARKHEKSSDTSIEQLKKEIVSLERQAEVADIELQSLRRQMAKETKRGQDLSRQVSFLKEEKEALRMECEKLSSRKNDKDGGVIPWEKETDSEDSSDKLREVEEELKHTKSVNKMLRRQLGKTQDSNSEMVLMVKDLEEKLDKKEKELARLSSELRNSRESEEFKFQHTDSPYKSDMDEKLGVARDLIPNGSHVKEIESLKEKIAELEEDLENEMEEKKVLQEKTLEILRDKEVLKQKNFDLSTKFDDARQQVIEKENQCNCYLRAIEELESEITRMEKVIEKQAEEFAESSDTIRRLETQVKDLENELQNQSQEYEDNLREIMNAKTEQEQRVLQVEEDLRKTKSNNAAEAERVQEEFQKLSTELASKFDENEKLTMQAQTEAKELRVQVTALEEQLRQANEDLRLMKDDHDIEVEKLSEQLMEKDKQLEQILVKLQEECKVIENAKQKHEWKSNALSKENEALRVEMERLTEENYQLSKQSKETENLRAELEVTKTSIGETKKFLEIANREKEDIEKKYSSSIMEAQQSQEELNNLRSSFEKKNSLIENFQSELQQLRAQCDELKKHLSEEKLQNENLNKQVHQQNEDLQKKVQEMANMEERYKNSSSKEGNGSKEKVKQHKIARGTATPLDNGSKVDEKRHAGRKQQTEACALSQNGTTRGSGKNRKEPYPEKNQKMSDVQSDNEAELTRLFSEVAELKDKNKSMESELKEMQEKYSEVSLRFAEVEGERQQLVMTVRNLRNGQKK